MTECRRLPCPIRVFLGRLLLRFFGVFFFFLFLMRQYEIIAHIIVEADSIDEALSVAVKESEYHMKRAAVEELEQ